MAQLPGPKTPFSLQTLAQADMPDGGSSNTWAEVTTFSGSLEPITFDEVATFDFDVTQEILRGDWGLFHGQLYLDVAHRGHQDDYRIHTLVASPQHIAY